MAKTVQFLKNTKVVRVSRRYIWIGDDLCIHSILVLSCNIFAYVANFTPTVSCAMQRSSHLPPQGPQGSLCTRISDDGEEKLPTYGVSGANAKVGSQCKKLLAPNAQAIGSQCSPRRYEGSSSDCILLATNGDIQAINTGSPNVHIHLHTKKKLDGGKGKMVGE